MISFVQKIIEKLVDLVVSAIKFLFYVWDYLVKPVLGSVIILIKEVAKFTITLILSIMTKALTGDLTIPVISEYKNIVKNKIINIIVNTDLSVINQYLNNQYNNINLEVVSEPLAGSISSALGPLDEFFQVFMFYQQFLEFPGIIKDILNLVGPSLAITLIIELLQKTISGIFEAIVKSWSINKILGFLDIINIEMWFNNNADNILDLFVGNIPSTELDGITTFSGLIQRLIDLGNLLNFSLWFNLLNYLMNNLKSAIQNEIFQLLINLISTFIGGFLYLINPVYPLSMTPQIKMDQISANSFTSQIAKVNILDTERLFDIGVFLFLGLFSRINNVVFALCGTGEELKFFGEVTSVLWGYVGWGYTMNDLIPKYGERFGYLGSNRVSFFLNQIGSLIDAALNLPEISSNKKLKLFMNIIKILFIDIPRILAAFFTGFNIFKLDPEAETFWKHFAEGDPVFLGDILFFVQAVVLYGVVNLDIFYMHLINGTQGFIPWDNYSITNTEAKKATTLFSAATILDIAMSFLFYINP